MFLLCISIRFYRFYFFHLKYLKIKIKQKFFIFNQQKYFHEICFLLIQTKFLFSINLMWAMETILRYLGALRKIKLKL